MTDTEPNLGTELARLRRSYLQRLPEELAALAYLAETLTGSEADRHSLEILHHRLHKLAGSGGTFGQHSLGQYAHKLEQTVRHWLASKPIAMDAASRDELAHALQRLPDTLNTTEMSYPEGIVSPRRTADDGQVIHIWLVEDDADVGQELVLMLAQFGYDVRLFTRVSDAESATRAAQPNVLIMDVLFPDEGLNGIEVMETHPRLRDLGCPILFISASGDFQSRVRAARLGAAGFFQKPLDAARLADCLERIFDERQAAPYRVLIIDDDATLSEHYRLVLSAAGMEVAVLNQPEAVLDKVSAFHPELVLMAMHMRGYYGPELATVIRHHDDWIGLPIVFLSAETDLDEQIRALGHGADDFITKPISDTRLVASIRVRVARSRQLADLMSRDSLTGLLKHAHIKEKLQVELVRARRAGKPLSVLMLDLDHFKTVNDTYGHAVGDQVIKAIAHLMKQRLRKTDGIGRYGGEEFALVLSECDARQAFDIMEDIRTRFAAVHYHHEGHEFACTVSAGIASFDPANPASGNDLLLAADKALYQAKRSGRNRVCVARQD